MPETTPAAGGGALRVSPWNLILLIPFLTLVTPWFNSIEPRLFGMPFFYWAQFAFVPVGVLCVAVVYLRTRDEASPEAAGDYHADEGSTGLRPVGAPVAEGAVTR